jgi:CheY-like chemotaxis protein
MSMQPSQQQSVQQQPVQQTILVVDDDRAMQDAVSMLLRDSGYAVVCQTSAVDALDWLERNPAPACILLDLMMPKMSGWAFSRELHTRRLDDVPLLVMTAALPHWGYPRAKGILTKPFDAELLLGALSCATAV